MAKKADSGRQPTFILSRIACRRHPLTVSFFLIHDIHRIATHTCQTPLARPILFISRAGLRFSLGWSTPIPQHLWSRNRTNNASPALHDRSTTTSSVRIPVIPLHGSTADLGPSYISIRVVITAIFSLVPYAGFTPCRQNPGLGQAFLSCI